MNKPLSERKGLPVIEKLMRRDRVEAKRIPQLQAIWRNKDLPLEKRKEAGMYLRLINWTRTNLDQKIKALINDN